MPKTIRQLRKDLLKAGFDQIKGGKGSHRKFVHEQVSAIMILSGQEGDDAKPYQEKQVEKFIKDSK